MCQDAGRHGIRADPSRFSPGGNIVQSWMLGATANVIIAVAYFAVSFWILHGVRRRGQWTQNPLAVATGLIFFTCAAGHGAHAEHLLLPGGSGALARQSWDWHLSILDAVTALVGIYYWSLRGRFPVLVRGTAIFEDFTVRQQQALEINDHIVQQLVTAKLAFETGDTETGMQAIEHGLQSSRSIIGDLVANDPASVISTRPGALRRQAIDA
jgi:hypothetical protein